MRRSLALLVAGTFFMENFDGTVITTALPRMAVSLHEPAVRLSVAITAYLVTLAVLIPVSGWIADRIGARTVFAVAIVVFTLASVLCAVSTTLAELVVARVLQGASLGVVPLGISIMRDLLPEGRVGSGVALMSSSLGIGGAVGLPVTGLVAEHTSWRWL